jgi:50S ribosomal subunit-associated GTPase HflX
MWISAKEGDGVDDLMERVAMFVKKVKVTLDLEEEKRKAIVFEDFRRLTMINIFTKKEKSISTTGESIFAEGFGLIEFYSKNKVAHFKLEKVISQKEWIQFISR